MDFSTAKVIDLLVLYGIRAIAALLIFIIGRWVAKVITSITKKIMVKGNTDKTLVTFVGNLTYVALLAFVIVAAINQLGIQTASFIAVIGAAGLAVGLALQGSLSNFAAGVLMLIFKPFKVDDFIEAAGIAGIVEEIKIFTTQLRTGDNKTIIIPNAKIMGNTITNFTTKGTRRADLIFGISYDDDIDKARQVIIDIVEGDERALKDPAPVVLVTELGDSSVNLTLRAWAAISDFWLFQCETIEKVKKRFDSEGITIPFPQRDVHLHEHKE